VFGRSKGGRPDKAANGAQPPSSDALIWGAPEQATSATRGQIAVDGLAEATAFISYSRKDSAIAEKLVSALRESGVEAFIDRRDIAPAEDWRSRLAALIASADSVVFVLSPDSAASEVCAWEVSEAERLGKRILPVLHREIEEVAPPAALSRLNYIFLRARDDMASATNKLAGAILTDITWVREHTRLGLAAERWRSLSYPESALLRGEVLSLAEAWLRTAPKSAPPPSELHREFIRSSLRAAADEAKERAETIEKLQLNQARFLADRARQLCGAGDPVQALLVSLEGLPDNSSTNVVARTRPVSAEALAMLCEATDAVLAFSFLGEAAEGVLWGAFSHMGDIFAAVHAEGVNVRRLLPQNELLLRVDTASTVVSIAFSTNGQFLAIACADGAVTIHEVKTGALTGELRVEGCVELALTLKGEWLLAVRGDQSAILWQTNAKRQVELPRTAAGADTPYSSLINGWCRQTNVRPGQWAALPLPDPPPALHPAPAPVSEAGPFIIGPRKQDLRHEVDRAYSPDRNYAAVCYENYNGFLLFKRTDDGKYYDAGWFEHDSSSWREIGMATVRFDKSGRRVLTASEDYTARIWDIETGDEIQRFSHPTQHWLAQAEFSADERFVITRSPYGYHLFAVASGREIKMRVGDMRGKGFPTVYENGDVHFPSKEGAGFFPAMLHQQTWIDRARLLAPAALPSAARAKVYLEREQPAWCARLGKYPNLPGGRVVPWRATRGEQRRYLEECVVGGITQELEAVLPHLCDAGPSAQRALIDASTTHFNGMIIAFMAPFAWMKDYNVDFEIYGDLCGATFEVAERFCDRGLVNDIVLGYSGPPSAAHEAVKSRLAQPAR
jgi:hypothetical protein